MFGIHTFRGPGRIGPIAALLIAASFIGTGAAPAEARSKRRLPPDVVLHPDRGLGITRFSKASHDQRLFKSLNEATRLPVRDPNLDPYNLVDRGVSTYDIQTGQIRGSLTDHYTEIRRGEENARRYQQERARIERASSPEAALAATKTPSAASRARTAQESATRPSRGTAGGSAAR